MPKKPRRLPLPLPASCSSTRSGCNFRAPAQPSKSLSPPHPLLGLYDEFPSLRDETRVSNFFCRLNYLSQVTPSLPVGIDKPLLGSKAPELVENCLGIECSLVNDSVPLASSKSGAVLCTSYARLFAFDHMVPPMPSEKGPLVNVVLVDSALSADFSSGNASQMNGNKVTSDVDCPLGCDQMPNVASVPGMNGGDKSGILMSCPIDLQANSPSAICNPAVPVVPTGLNLNSDVAWPHAAAFNTAPLCPRPWTSLFSTLPRNASSYKPIDFDIDEVLVHPPTVMQAGIEY